MVLSKRREGTIVLAKENTCTMSLNNGGQNDPEVAQVISHGSALDPFINFCFQYYHSIVTALQVTVWILVIKGILVHEQVQGV